ncbi:hypothetical protein F3Y22_tig00112864pilonHSYRG00034 [Hibiscus syriacus]|uniref:Uncharacterized protein n=1 Tax=Hibiscus syriacus TaxID=106335 RepID=A0A6A2XPB1_HIBSY|nr:hypothetical protein F3Y22_tig00112864pilonHSYRG00034 [Hibiscus syriacus]
MPPPGREMIFAKPKLAAMIPAVWSFRAGMKNAIRQAVNLTAPMSRMRPKTTGMISCVAPPPRFPHPPATPLAVPTTGAENMELIQNWVDTKVAREKPVKKRTRRKDGRRAMEPSKHRAGDRRDPRISNVSRRQVRLSRMIGRSGGAVKVDTQNRQNENPDRWNARMCGAAAEYNRNSVALCSESTGRANFG